MFSACSLNERTTKVETHVEGGSQVSCPLTTMDKLKCRFPKAHSQSVGVGPRTLHLTGTWASQPGTALQGERWVGPGGLGEQERFHLVVDALRPMGSP